MYNIKIHNLDSGRELNFTPAAGIFITEHTGLTENEIEYSTSQGVSQVGVTIGGTTVKERLITLTGKTNGGGTEFRRQLIQTITPPRQGRIAPYLRVTFDNERFIDGVAQTTPEVSMKPEHIDFYFSIMCPYPYWRSLEDVSHSVSGLEKRFRFPVNYSNPATHRFSERTDTVRTEVDNEGDVDTAFKLTFTALGEAENPSLINVNNPDEFIRFKKEMHAGDILELDATGYTFKASFTSGGVTEDALKYYDINSSIMVLATGSNLYQREADAGRQNVVATINYYKTYAGAYGTDDVYI